MSHTTTQYYSFDHQLEKKSDNHQFNGYLEQLEAFRGQSWISRAPVNTNAEYIIFATKLYLSEKAQISNPKIEGFLFFTWHSYSEHFSDDTTRVNT